MKSFKRTQMGFTLLEVVVTMTIAALFIVIISAILANGYQNFQRTSLETQMRDDADYVMGEFLKKCYSKPASTLTLPKENEPSSIISVSDTKEEFGFDQNGAAFFKDQTGAILQLNSREFDYSKSTLELGKDGMLTIHLLIHSKQRPSLQLQLKSELYLLD